MLVHSAVAGWRYLRRAERVALDLWSPVALCLRVRLGTTMVVGFDMHFCVLANGFQRRDVEGKLVVVDGELVRKLVRKLVERH